MPNTSLRECKMENGSTELFFTSSLMVITSTSLDQIMPLLRKPLIMLRLSTLQHGTRLIVSLGVRVRQQLSKLMARFALLLVVHRSLTV
jgi:hypothetical protein